MSRRNSFDCQTDEADVIRLAQENGFASYGGACRSDGIQTLYLVWRAIWSALFVTLAALALGPAVAKAGLAKGAELEWKTTIRRLLRK